MDTSLLAQSLGVGLAAGMVIMAVASIILIPASYMMNRFIYHNAFMRLLIGILSGAGSFFVFLFLIVKRWRGWSKAHYFGLVPIFQAGDGTGEDAGKMAFFSKIIRLFTHPLIMFYTSPDDTAGYEAAITQGLRLVSAEKTGTPMKLHGTDVTVKDGTVSEEFFEAASNVATITKKAGWTNQFEDGTLTTIGKALYGE